MAQITVMGAGIFGLSAAWIMARRGASVTVIERDRVGAGSSGGIVGALAPHVPELWNTKKAFQLQSLLIAQGFWADVAASGGVDPGYARTGRLQPIADEDALQRAQERVQGARELWQGQAEWRVIRAADAPGFTVNSPSGWAIFDTLTARLSPRAASASLVAGLRRMGVDIVTGDTPPENSTVLWATGAAGIDALTADLGQPMGNAVKGQSALFKADFRDAPQLFADWIHVVPHADGTVAVGSTSERHFDDPTSTDALLETLIAQARTTCPELTHAPLLERWAGLRPRSQTRSPMLGAWPGRPGHYVLNGGFKIGFGMAPILAQLAADLLLDGNDAVPDGFRVEDNIQDKKAAQKKAPTG
ncbi:FAD-binding oxidoreductase [Pararhodobacter sp.]|uniref:NAD(P)/FAD-dependent oxidoreductase n=1 Tax=Pararhodobacter sp. TaxID=2127056 RepID=UPI002B002F03|nr:FAD-binding oxidoreductase [Pararhodobacter sp.]